MTKAIFWDFDGTLVLPNERFIDTFILSAERFNFKPPRDIVKSHFVSIYPWNSPDTVYPYETGSLWWNRFFGALDVFYKNNDIPGDIKDEINSDFKYQMINNNTYTLYDDTKDTLLKCISLGYTNYVLSNNYPELPKIIENFKLDGLFADYFVSANIGYEKPRRELFQFALSSAGFPDIAYMIGDNPIADIEGAMANGLKTVIVHKGNISNADFKCDKLAEIPELLI